MNDRTPRDPHPFYPYPTLYSFESVERSPAFNASRCRHPRLVVVSTLADFAFEVAEITIAAKRSNKSVL